MGIVAATILFLFFNCPSETYWQKVKSQSGTLMTAAVTETRVVARDGDRRHIKHGPG